MNCHSEPGRREGKEPRGSLHSLKLLRYPSLYSVHRPALAGLGLLLFYTSFAAPINGQHSAAGTDVASQTVPGVKPGSIDDVNAIGHRKIGGRGFGNWYSNQTEVDWGNEIAAQILESATIVHDPIIDGYVNRIGHNIVKNSDCKTPFTIEVVDSAQINAFALPGGYLFINAGLILAADNEAQLAAVMAHEIAHVAAHHEAREMTRLHYADLSMAPLVMTGAGLPATVAIPLPFLQFQRKFEEQADWLGVQYMYKAGYDPRQMVGFFQKIEALQKNGAQSVARNFSTHPETPARIKRTQHEIATLLPPQPHYMVNTPEFQAIQTRLRRIGHRAPASQNKTPAHPALRSVGTAAQSPQPK
jgi:predicted Zn-dependent protease